MSGLRPNVIIEISTANCRMLKLEALHGFNTGRGETYMGSTPLLPDHAQRSQGVGFNVAVFLEDLPRS
jgi:hypothetical protein